AAPAAAGIWPGPGVRRLRRDHHGDRLLLSGHRPPAAQRGQRQRLPDDAGHLPGHYLRRPARQPGRGPGAGLRRSAGASEGGVLMTTATPLTAISQTPTIAVTPKAAGQWRRLPLKAKIGAIVLGLFVLAAVIGPLVMPYDPSYSNPAPSLALHAPDSAHLLGTTQSGQDVLSQLLVGIRLTLELALFVGLAATALSV